MFRNRKNIIIVLSLLLICISSFSDNTDIDIDLGTQYIKAAKKHLDLAIDIYINYLNNNIDQLDYVLKARSKLVSALLHSNKILYLNAAKSYVEAALSLFKISSRNNSKSIKKSSASMISGVTLATPNVMFRRHLEKALEFINFAISYYDNFDYVNIDK